MNLINKTIFCKDNLEILRGIDSGCVDMIYLDPPFNSKKSWHAPIGSAAEGAEFKDTWTSDDVKEEWVQEIRAEHPVLHEFLKSFSMWGGQSDVAYITYMAIRIIEMKRILKDTGTLWYHCDHYMNDYIKIMLDIIFGRHHDLNNIVWCYGAGGTSKKYFPKKHDNIFWYAKSKDWTFNNKAKEVRTEFSKTAQDMHFKNVDENGRRYRKRTINGKDYIYYADEGKLISDWWTDINSQDASSPLSKEYNGYPTQKPLSLLRRIIAASTNEDDFILDPFCGCATTCVAAEQLGRRWVGIDVSEKAYELVKDRLKVDAPSSLFSQIPVNFTTIPPKRGIWTKKDDWKSVYVISNSAYPGEYKVGIASNVKSRLNSYQTSDPNRGYKLEFSMECQNYRDVEKATHAEFPNKHEWVHAELNDIVNFIKSKL